MTPSVQAQVCYFESESGEFLDLSTICGEGAAQSGATPTSDSPPTDPDTTSAGPASDIPPKSVSEPQQREVTNSQPVVTESSPAEVLRNNARDTGLSNPARLRTVRGTAVSQ
ncbi:MAG: hypothetical protein AAGG02_07670 [Cyanobacteria bacterium P01_H01_bin.15]